MSHIMSGRAIAIKGRGGFTDFPVSIQYLGEPAPCILKESVRRPSCHSGDRAVTQAIELSLRRP
ncbi:hypothetical protein QUB19_05200, partial [Microcoleus sp. B4-C5]|uniref:hypothetical protein n=1 Tax=Microcoleus sp. B4-C5 TaxID=2818664 RepID=UPI002FD2B46E